MYLYMKFNMHQYNKCFYSCHLQIDNTNETTRRNPHKLRIRLCTYKTPICVSMCLRYIENKSISTTITNQPTVMVSEFYGSRLSCVYIYIFTHILYEESKKNYNKNHTIFNRVSNSNRGSSFNIKHHHIRQHYTARSTSEAINEEREAHTAYSKWVQSIALKLIHTRHSACALTPLTFLICDDRFSFKSNSVGIRCVVTIFRDFNVFLC